MPAHELPHVAVALSNSELHPRAFRTPLHIELPEPLYLRRVTSEHTFRSDQTLVENRTRLTRKRTATEPLSRTRSTTRRQIDPETTSRNRRDRRLAP